MCVSTLLKFSDLLPQAHFFEKNGLNNTGSETLKTGFLLLR